MRPYRIAVAGTHSTGKSTFLGVLRNEFEARGVVARYVHDSAAKARELGFPILSEHTFESTAWLVAHAIELETEATLMAEVILIDRPVPDALGYLLAALEHTDRELAPGRLDRLEAICRAWSAEYDLVFLTVLDPNMPLGEGRDDDAIFRRLAGAKVASVVDRYIPHRRLLHNGERAEAVAAAVEAYEAYWGTSPGPA
jgi:AAA domain